MAKDKSQPVIKKSSKKNVSIPKNGPMAKSVNKIPLSRQQIEESIRLKAYELYLMRLGQNGSPLSDWLDAERIILQA